ncbi:50S ribosomal protein L4 [Candidatus Woesearchaeota archaeon]|nr:50S ribosomal protein L4 [Candidatus Woesearchaeota archaeon]
MKLKILAPKGELGSIDLPKQFSEPIRFDLIKRAVLALQSHKRQPYGASIEAGMRHSTTLRKRRRKYRGSYGKGISRVPRKILSRRGSQLYWVGARAPGTVGGRRAHPPKAEKILAEKINDKERRKAIRSALHATMEKSIVESRGHIVPKEYPFVVSEIESLAKTKDVKQLFLKLGFESELERSSKKNVRAGKGKLRGRKYVRKKGLLLVVAQKCPLLKAARNIPGVDVITVESLNTELLAPGAVAGRATLFTKQSIEKLEKENLFVK